MLETSSTVRSRVLPPAPYVTETYVGLSSWSAATVSINCPRFSCLGGKNSKEKAGRPEVSSSRMRIIPKRGYDHGSARTWGYSSSKVLEPYLREKIAPGRPVL